MGGRARLGAPAVRDTMATCTGDGARGPASRQRASSSRCCAPIPISGRRARMSDASVGEQAGAGLDGLTPPSSSGCRRLNRRISREGSAFRFCTP